MFFDYPSSWKNVLSQELKQPYFKNLMHKVNLAYAQSLCYPEIQHLFKAFELCSFENIKVVIIGQDPYHGPNQANGLCFSVNEGVAIPPSLKNIYKELADDLQQAPPATGSLAHWANQGVLLLNATLSVKANEAGSHHAIGWEQFTDAVIRVVSEQQAQVVFLLWGAYAHKKIPLIDTQKHLVLTSAHPSPLSAYRGFLGCKHFSATNNYLRQHGKMAIAW
jgi:uracil-DNA glycosylase